MNVSTILMSMFFGTVGVGYFMYGRKEQKGAPLIAGIALSIFPFFVSNVGLSLLIGAALMAFPFYVDF